MTETYQISFISKSEFDRVAASEMPESARLATLTDMARLNALSAVKRAGSGHLGSSFSSLDIVIHLYFKEMNVLEVGLDSPDRDLYFSSKGHDCPGYYAALEAAGILDPESILTLRRLGGLDGHPDLNIPGVEANSGSLGMGIAKGKGMAIAKRLGAADTLIKPFTMDALFDSVRTILASHPASRSVDTEEEEITEPALAQAEG